MTHTSKRCGIHRWLVVASACLTTCLGCGLVVSMGALFVSTAEKFGTSRSETTLVQSVAIGASICAVIAGVLVERYGLCRVALVGAALTVAGLGAGFFATTIIHLYVAAAIAGTGITTVYVCATVSVGLVTEGRAKSAALAINSSCIGLGAVVYPHLLTYLTKNFGLNGTYLILAGLCCHDAILVVLLSTVDDDASSNTDHDITNTATDFSENASNKCYAKVISLIDSLIENMKQKCVNIFSVPYVLTWIAAVSIIAALDGYLAIYVDLYTWKTFSEQQGITSMSIYQLCCVAAGLLVALLKQSDAVSTFAITIVYSLVGCVGMAVTYVAASLPVTYVGSGLLGVTEGVISCESLIVAELVPQAHLGTALGIILTTLATVALATGPIFGAIMDTMNSYVAVCVVTGIIDVCAAVLFLVAWLVHRRSTASTAPREDETVLLGLSESKHKDYTRASH